MNTFRNTSIYYVSYLLLILLAFSCRGKEDISPTREYPQLFTTPVSNKSAASVTFNATVTKTNATIIDHGFIWAFNKSFNGEQKISLGAKFNSTQFSADLAYPFIKGRRYYVKPYVITDRHNVYGPVLEFQNENGIAHVISNFYPKTATWRDIITIEGEFTHSNLKVMFVNSATSKAVEAPILKADGKKITVKVPDAVDNIENTIQVQELNYTSSASENFKLATPEITKVSLVGYFVSGYFLLIIEGQNLHPDLAYNKISSKSGGMLHVLSSSSKKIEVVFSELPKTNPFTVTLQLAGSTIESPYIYR